MRIDRRIYGPHPKVRGARVLLAFAGQEVSRDEYDRILAAERGLAPVVTSDDVDTRSGFTSTEENPEQGDTEDTPTDVADLDGDDELDEDDPGIRHVGGGWYELPNGERVHGRDAAEAALDDVTAED